MKRLFAILVLAAVGYAALPYWSAYSLAQGVKAGDRDVLEQRVDWPSVRSGLKEDLSDIAVGNESGAAGLLRAALAPALLDTALDQLVTPATVASLAQGAARAKDRSGGGQGDAAEDLARDPVAHLTWAFFTSPSQFLVKLESRRVQDGVAELFFERRGLSWPLVRVKLPDSVLSGLTS